MTVRTRQEPRPREEEPAGSGDGSPATLPVASAPAPERATGPQAAPPTTPRLGLDAPPGEGCGACGAPSAEAPREGGRCEECGAALRPGGFQVKRLLAQRPHGRMYLAEAPDGRLVALKELVYAAVPDVATLEAFEREATLLRQLRHPQIPAYVASFQEGSKAQTRLYLAQEYVEGPSLAQKLEQHRFSEPEVKGLAREVLGILAYLHGRSPRIIHRDIKPANLLVRPDGRLCLVDFDAARDIRPGGTHRATFVGTFGYMPPEQLGGTVDATADLYALGATLLHLLTRLPPERCMDEQAHLRVDDRANVSPAFKAWIEKTVAFTRKERFASVEAAREALDRLDVTPAPGAEPLREPGGAPPFAGQVGYGRGAARPGTAPASGPLPPGAPLRSTHRGSAPPGAASRPPSPLPTHDDGPQARRHGRRARIVRGGAAAESEPSRPRHRRGLRSVRFGVLLGLAMAAASLVGLGQSGRGLPAWLAGPRIEPGHTSQVSHSFVVRVPSGDVTGPSEVPVTLLIDRAEYLGSQVELTLQAYTQSGAELSFDERLGLRLEDAHGKSVYPSSVQRRRGIALRFPVEGMKLPLSVVLPDGARVPLGF